MAEQLTVIKTGKVGVSGSGSNFEMGEQTQSQPTWK